MAHPTAAMNATPLRTPEPWKNSLRILALAVCLATSVPGTLGAYRDTPFIQATPRPFSSSKDLDGTSWRRLVVTRDDVAFALSDKGLARNFGEKLAPDSTLRSAAGKPPLDIYNKNGQLFYLFRDEVSSPADAGKHLARLPANEYRSFAVADDYSYLLGTATNLVLLRGSQLQNLAIPGNHGYLEIYAFGNAFLLTTPDGIYKIQNGTVTLVHQAKDITCLGFRGDQLFVGTKHGYYVLNSQSWSQTVPLQTRLPVTDITCLLPVKDGLWAGTPRGVFFQNASGGLRYFASRRWLPNDQVVALQTNRSGALYALTAGGLVRFDFNRMTLAQKAAFFDQKIRQRHIRYGFNSELRLREPGDVTTAEMIDTDNDGTWTSYYLASQAFRFAATGDEDARQNAWEAFSSLERLQSIHNVAGFPARTFERKGFKVSDPDRWRPAPDPNWEWKGHTSSDEITAHTFAYAVLYETCARAPAEKARIANLYDRLLSHLLAHDLYLVDVDGKPTLWGRWNPEYVNHYPPSIVDRRLNSAEIIAYLQFGFRITGKPVYRDRAIDLLQNQGYLQNITNSIFGIQYTPGYVFEGNDMGNEYNHSDDMLAFANYWTLYRFALDDSLRRIYAEAIRDHWEFEKTERNPVWSMICSLVSPGQCDLEGAVWTLQRFPLDTIDWAISNSHRQDIVRLPDNFRHQLTQEVLPPDERPISRWTGNAFNLDGGNGGRTELSGDEFLLPYWMGRYLGQIADK